MESQVLISLTRNLLAFLVVAIVASCSAERTVCGGRIYPDQPSSDALIIVKKARSDSRKFCSDEGAGCDFTIARTKQGWSVAAIKVFAVDGKCASRMGDEKFYSYDSAGSLVRVIDGL